MGRGHGGTGRAPFQSRAWCQVNGEQVSGAGGLVVLSWGLCVGAGAREGLL